jgi:hypothetical protein
MSKEVNITDEFGLPDVKMTTSMKYEMKPVSGNLRLLEGLASHLLKEFGSKFPERGSLDLDEVFNLATNKMVVGWRPVTIQEIGKHPYCGRKLYLGTIKVNIKFKTGVNWFTVKKDGTGFGAYGAFWLYKHPDVLPEVLLNDLGDLSSNPEFDQKAYIDDWFKKNGFPVTEVKIWMDQIIKEKIESIVQKYVKPEDTFIPIKEFLIAFVGKDLSVNWEEKQEGTKVIKTRIVNLNLDDLYFFKPIKQQ